MSVNIFNAFCTLGTQSLLNRWVNGDEKRDSDKRWGEGKATERMKKTLRESAQGCAARLTLMSSVFIDEWITAGIVEIFSAMHTHTCMHSQRHFKTCWCLKQECNVRQPQYISFSGTQAAIKVRRTRDKFKPAQSYKCKEHGSQILPLKLYKVK